jgi:hypothetical protein
LFETQNTLAANPLFTAIDANKLISDIAGILGQTLDELRAFICALYYDPQAQFIYDIWGRTLPQSSPKELKEPESIRVPGVTEQ